MQLVELVVLPAQQDPGEAERRIREILSRPEFAPPEPSLLERFLDWIGRQLDRLVVGGPSLGAGGAQVVGWLAVAAVLVVLVVVLVRVLRHLPARVRDESTREATVLIDRSREPTDWRAESAQHAAAGRWRDALRCRYRALVGDLARRGLLDEIPGRTTGEERRQLQQVAPAASPQFTAATDLFDRAWYGAEPTGPDEHDRFCELEGSVLEATEGGR
jgi:hypothetical protein